MIVLVNVFSSRIKDKPTIHPRRTERVSIISIDITDPKKPYRHLTQIFLAYPYEILIKRYTFCIL